MEEKKEFNQLEYKMKYSKEHYKVFKVDLKKEEMEELNKLLEKHKLTKADFLRNSINELKKK